MRKFVLGTAVALALTSFPIIGSASAEMVQHDGWSVVNTNHSFDALNAKLDAAIAAADMGLVSQASASAGASRRGLTIPGNRVVGVYRNDFAIRMLDASIAAGIEAPIRFYVTENADGSATLSYKKPSTVFAPYLDEGGDSLRALANELDGIFEQISSNAVKQ